MRRRVALALAAVVLVLAGAAVLVRSDDAWTLGVPSRAPVVTLEPGQEVCQGPVRLPPGVRATGVTLQLGTFGRPAGPPLAVQAERAGRPVSRGRVPGGYPDVVQDDRRRARLEVPDRPFDLCVRNDGRTPVALYGDGGTVDDETTARLDGSALDVDVDVRFTGADRSFLARTPEMLRRASLWRPGLVSPALLLLLGLAIVVTAAALAPWLLEDGGAGEDERGRHGDAGPAGERAARPSPAPRRRPRAPRPRS